MKTYEIKRYDSPSDYGKDNLDQCTPVVITEEHMTTYLLCVHCDDFATALNQFCEVFANENVDWEPVVDRILEHDRYSNFWIQFTEEFSYVFLWKEIWKENGLCKVTINIYHRNIPTDETTGEEIKGESNTEAETDETTAKAMVVEPCPHCESEIEMEWDVKTQGYKATCPVCGNLLMLCDECQRRGEDGEDLDDCDFDGRDGSCRFNPKGNIGNSQDSSRVYCPVLGGWIMHYDACRGGCEYDSETDTCKLYRNNTRKGGDDRNG